MNRVEQLFRESFLPGMALGVCLIVAAVVIYYVRSWLRDNSGPDEYGGDFMSSLREMQQDGELTEEEYRLIKGRLISGQKQAVNVRVAAPLLPTGEQATEALDQPVSSESSSSCVTDETTRDP